MKAGWQIKMLGEVLRLEIESTHKVELNPLLTTLRRKKLP